MKRYGLLIIAAILFVSCQQFYEIDYTIENTSSKTVTIIDKSTIHYPEYTLSPNQSISISHYSFPDFIIKDSSLPVKIYNGYSKATITELPKYTCNFQNSSSVTVTIKTDSELFTLAANQSTIKQCYRISTLQVLYIDGIRQFNKTYTASYDSNQQEYNILIE